MQELTRAASGGSGIKFARHVRFEDSRTHIRNAADDINLQTVKDGAGINVPVSFLSTLTTSFSPRVAHHHRQNKVGQVKATRQRNKWSTHDQKLQFCRLAIS